MESTEVERQAESAEEYHERCHPILDEQGGSYLTDDAERVVPQAVRHADDSRDDHDRTKHVEVFGARCDPFVDDVGVVRTYVNLDDGGDQDASALCSDHDAE